MAGRMEGSRREVQYHLIGYQAFQHENARIQDLQINQEETIDRAGQLDLLHVVQKWGIKVIKRIMDNL